MKPVSAISFFNLQLTICEWSWILFFISLPAGRPFTTYTLVLIVFASLYSTRKDFIKNAKQNLKICWPLFLFYFFHLTGLFYSDDLSFALKDLSVKLPLVVIPLTAAFSGLTDSFSKKAAFAFSYSCVAVNLFLLIRAILNHSSGVPDAFFYDSYSVFIHPAYMALMNVIAISILIFDFSFSDSKKKIVTLSSLVLLSASVILLASKAGIVSMLIVYLIFVLKSYNRKNRFTLTLASALVVLSAVILIWISPARERIKQALAVFRQPDKAATMQEGTASRLLAWKTAWQISKDYFPMGTGTGDIKNVTLSYYEKSGYGWPLYYRLNAHNQFLQSLAATGIGGLVSLAFIILIPIIRCNKEKSLPLIFTLMVFINLLFESMLEVQNGVMLITAFYTLWTVNPFHSKK